VKRVFAVAAVAVLAACGGGGRLSHDAYQHELRSVARPLQAALLRPEAPNATRKQIARRVGEVQRALRRAADRLDALSPPHDADEANAHLVAALRKFAAALDGVRSAALGGTAEAIREANDEARRSPGATELNRAVGELTDAGYQVR
jgi:hypothetical protein